MEHVGTMTEPRLVERFLARLADVSEAANDLHAAVEIGPGDDAAVIRSAALRLVLTVDQQIEGVHFRRSWLTPEQLGRRAVTIAVSDLAAMGARPTWTLCAAQLPPDLEIAWLDGLADGLAAGGRANSCPLIGGDVTVATDRVSLCMTAGGVLEDGLAPLTRTGARPRDACWVVGALGAAAAGRALLERGASLSGAAAERCVEAYRSPVAQLQVGAGVAAAGLATAAMDVSDGLALDLGRLCAASGVGVRVEADSIVLPDLATVAASLGLDAQELALGGGDDYALLCAVGEGNGAALERLARRHGVPAVRVGEFTEAGDGLTLRSGGQIRRLAPQGWDPFAADPGP